MVLFTLSLCPLYFLWSGNWVLEAWFDSGSTFFGRNSSWLMRCALNWSTSGGRRSGFPVMSGQVWSLGEGSVCRIYPLQSDIPSPCMVSKQSMGWHSDTSCFVTVSNGDTCLSQLLHWCLENGDFLIIPFSTPISWYFFKRNLSFQFCPPFLVESITMGSRILIYLLCYNQLVILPCVQIG